MNMSFCDRCQETTETANDSEGNNNVCSICWAVKNPQQARRLTKTADTATKKAARQEMQQAMFRVIKILTHVQHRHGQENWPTVWPTSHFSETEAWSADQIVKITKHGL